MTKSVIGSRLALLSIGFAFCVGLTAPATAGVLEYGDEDVLNNTGIYGGDPKAGATLQGLAADVVTFGAPELNHGFPFTPSAGEFPGTDQIYVGSVQTGFHEGYSNSPRINGPQVITLDYSALVPAGHSVITFTLGIAADDFQFPPFGQPFVAKLNGGNAVALTNTLNGLDQSGPQVQFFTIGLDTSLDNASHTLTLSIDQGGDGGDGWAIDYLTIGVTTQAAPEPASLALLAVGLAVFGAMRGRRG